MIRMRHDVQASSVTAELPPVAVDEVVRLADETTEASPGVMSTGAYNAAATVAWAPVDCATTSALEAVADAGFMTLTSSINTRLMSIDDVYVKVGSRILVKNQADNKENGVYELTNSGSNEAPWVLTRAADADENTDFCIGKRVLVKEGPTYTNNMFEYTVTRTEVGTTNIIFRKLVIAAEDLVTSMEFELVGDGQWLEHTVTHNLASSTIVVNAYRPDTGADVDVDVQRIDSNTIKIIVATPVAANAKLNVIVTREYEAAAGYKTYDATCFPLGRNYVLSGLPVGVGDNFGVRFTAPDTYRVGAKFRVLSRVCTPVADESVSPLSIGGETFSVNTRAALRQWSAGNFAEGEHVTASVDIARGTITRPDKNPLIPTVKPKAPSNVLYYGGMDEEEPEDLDGVGWSIDKPAPSTEFLNNLVYSYDFGNSTIIIVVGKPMESWGAGISVSTDEYYSGIGDIIFEHDVELVMLGTNCLVHGTMLAGFLMVTPAGDIRTGPAIRTEIMLEGGTIVMGKMFFGAYQGYPDNAINFHVAGGTLRIAEDVDTVCGNYYVDGGRFMLDNTNVPHLGAFVRVWKDMDPILICQNQQYDCTDDTRIVYSVYGFTLTVNAGYAKVIGKASYGPDFNDTYYDRSPGFVFVEMAALAEGTIDATIYDATVRPFIDHNHQGDPGGEWDEGKQVIPLTPLLIARENGRLNVSMHGGSIQDVPLLVSAESTSRVHLNIKDMNIVGFTDVPEGETKKIKLYERNATATVTFTPSETYLLENNPNTVEAGVVLDAIDTDEYNWLPLDSAPPSWLKPIYM